MKLTKKEFLEIFYYTPKYFGNLANYAEKYMKESPFYKISEDKKIQLKDCLAKKDETISTLQSYIYKYSSKDEKWTKRAMMTIGPDMLLPENINLNISEDEFDKTVRQPAVNTIMLYSTLAKAVLFIDDSVLDNFWYFEPKLQINSLKLITASAFSLSDINEREGFFKAFANYGYHGSQVYKFLTSELEF